MTIGELVKLSGLNKTDFAKRYGIPYRTLNSWDGGYRAAPAYVLALLERAVREDALAESRPKIDSAILDYMATCYGLAPQEGETEEEKLKRIADAMQK